MESQRETVSLDDALRAVGGLLRRRTDTVLPYYALVAATADVTRLPLLVGVVVATLVLASTGRLEPLLDDLASLNPELLGSNTPTGLPPEVGERVAVVLFSPSVVGPLVLAVVAALVVSVLTRGVTRAAALSAFDAGLRGKDPLPAGVAGMRRWKTFAGLVVLRWGLLALTVVPLAAAVVGGAATLGTAADPTALDRRAVVAVLAALVGVLVTLVGIVVVLALLAFAGPAAVVDDRDLVGAIRKSVSVPFAHPVGFLLYGVVVVGVSVLLGVGGVLFGVAGVDRLVTVASAFLVSPLLDGVAVALYTEWTDADGAGTTANADDGATTDERVTFEGVADASGFVFGGSESVGNGTRAERGDDGVRDGDAGDRAVDSDGSRPDDTGDGSRNRNGPRRVVSDVRHALVGGLRELGGFVREDWRYVVLSATTLMVGIVGGWRVTAGSGVRIDTPADPAGVFGLVPVGPFVNITVNNWFVATTAGFSGLFAGLPTLGTLLFNGLLVGSVAGVVDPVTFLAFVGPHGVVELPAIAVAGGVGLRLGHVAWGVWRGSRSTAALVDELERTWRLVLGLLVVFVVAGFVEAFVTPQVAAAVL